MCIIGDLAHPGPVNSDQSKKKNKVAGDIKKKSWAERALNTPRLETLGFDTP